MAIFRAGKRIGPFDIRGGISRGDYKSSAYHKTDKDPRFKQRGNTDNTIGRFRAAMNQGEGFARPSRYAIRLFPPSMLEGAIAAQNSSVDRGGSKFIPLHDYHEKSKQLTSLNNTIGRQVNIMCDTVNMPGVDLQTQEIQYGSEPNYNQVTSHGFAGNIVATFYADKYLRERQFFEHWQKLVVDTISHKAKYYDDYIGKMHIYQLGADTEVNRDMPTYAIEAMEVYPATIGQVEYAYGKTNDVVKITVGFAYKYWRNMASTTSSLSFGRHNQTPAEIKARDRGLYGMLPPELQRMGRDVFSQGRTVLNPIGRIFGGKVFPPFT